MSTSGSQTSTTADGERNEPSERSEESDSIQGKTLERDGPIESQGSGGHPSKCVPCAFYCYSLRGCNKGDQCSFCHMTHSKRKTRGARGKRGKKSAGSIDGEEQSSPTSAGSPDGLHAPPGVFLPFGFGDGAVGAMPQPPEARVQGKIRGNIAHATPHPLAAPTPTEMPNTQLGNFRGFEAPWTQIPQPQVATAARGAGRKGKRASPQPATGEFPQPNGFGEPLKVSHPPGLEPSANTWSDARERLLDLITQELMTGAASTQMKLSGGCNEFQRFQ